MDDVYDAQIARIQQKVSQTRGVWLHPPASIDQIEAVERDHNVQLPLAYRRFLLEVGNGGWFWTWPLYPLAEALSKVEGRLSEPFPFTGNFSVDEQKEALLFDEHLDYDLDGALTIFYFGCTHSDILVMNGPYVGTVMYNGSGTDQGFVPYTQHTQAFVEFDELAANSTRLDYLGWFENKLDHLTSYQV